MNRTRRAVNATSGTRHDDAAAAGAPPAPADARPPPGPPGGKDHRRQSRRQEAVRRLVEQLQQADQASVKQHGQGHRQDGPQAVAARRSGQWHLCEIFVNRFGSPSSCWMIHA